MVRSINGADTIPDLLSSHTASLADIPNKNFNSSLVKQFLAKSFQGIGSGPSINVIGDSISQGVGASVIDNSYASQLFQGIANVTNNGQGSGYELTANFQAPPKGFTYGGSYSYGVLGPAKKSIILQPGATIQFTRSPYWIELYFHQTPTSGQIQFQKDGVTYRTLNCAGTDKLDQNSFGTIVNLDQKSHVYTLTCLNSPVEITGVMCVGKYSNANTILYNRFAVSGTTSAYWNDANVLASQKIIGAVNGTSVFILAIGTNDCYQVGGAVASSVYQSNMTAIINSLLAAGHYVVLVIPPKANESVYPPQVEPYKNYVQVVKNLAAQFNLPYTDLSTIDFNGKGWLADNIHPNDNGHYAIANFHLDTLGIPKTISQAPLPIESPNSITYQNGWSDYNSGLNAIVRYYQNNGIVYLDGLAKGGTITNGTVLFNLPANYRPFVDRYFNIANDQGTDTQIKISSTGDVSIVKNGSAGYLSFDGVVFRALV